MKTIRFAVGLALCAAAGAAIAVPVSFPGTNTGAIPDGEPSGRTLSFVVSGINAPLASVSVSLNLSHTYAGDLTATLIAPGGVARLILFGRAAAGLSSTFGDSSNLGGVYTFTDAGFPDFVPLLQSIGDTATLPAGPFRTVSRGAPGRSNAGGCPTSLRGVFGGLAPAQVNGTWTLLITDASTPDAGAISAATLTLDSGVLFANGFETPALAAPSAPATEVTFVPRAPEGIISAPAHCINKVQADFTGDGLTDFALARANGSNIDWFIRENLGNGTASATETTFTFGNTNDLIDSADLDGDRIADPMVWTPGEAGVAAYRARLSSRNGAPRVIVFGQTRDNALQSGDYDGDGIDDVAYLRAPAVGTPAGPIRLQFLRSSNDTLGSVQTGIGVDGSQFPISGWDYNGDGLADVVIQRADTATPTLGRFDLFNASGTSITSFVLGNASDFLVPGNYTGSPFTDVTTRRTVSGNREWRTRDSQTGLEVPVVTFSITGDQTPGGDYDGDGLSDHAAWRPSAMVGMSSFQIRPSTSIATTFTINFGQQGDFPVAASRVQ